MEYRDAILGRRSVRKYSDKKVPREILEKILEDAMWAPSACNLQPWYFVVVQSDEKMAELRQLTYEMSSINRKNLEKRFADHPEVVDETVNYIANMGNAPMAILVFRDKPDYSAIMSDDGIVQSISAAVENLSLSAHAYGIGTCWQVAPNRAGMGPTFKEHFAPDHGDLVCMLTVGYPADDEISKAPKRKENKFEFI